MNEENPASPLGAATGCATHDHTCHCGTSAEIGGHTTGECGCVRRMCAAPRQKSCEPDKWVVEGKTITAFTLRFQRHYHQHPCGCWSRSEMAESHNEVAERRYSGR